MFASDYPHPEGGRDPVGRFDSTLDEWKVSDSARDKFYQHNFARLLHID
ncbi:MAG: putative TIM-barrel fold metal-dependent hydrolase [Candidatus Azotimanducaceae bacterium]|jgi:predicted TIM-barrel fold metal-dependent hydrolase